MIPVGPAKIAMPSMTSLTVQFSIRLIWVGAAVGFDPPAAVGDAEAWRASGAFFVAAGCSTYALGNDAGPDVVPLVELERRRPSPCPVVGLLGGSLLGRHGPILVWGQSRGGATNSLRHFNVLHGQFLCSPGGRFFVPTSILPGAPRAAAVKAGRRCTRAAGSTLARPRLDGGKPGARLRVGTIGGELSGRT
jgi:hypothetical protein